MRQQVLEKKKKTGIPYVLLNHPAVVTTEESQNVVHVSGCASCKSLYVKDKKSDNYYLVVLPFDKRADMRRLASYVGCAKFEFATEQVLEEHLHVHRGSVSPFAFLFEKQGRDAPLLIDEDIFKMPKVKFHPCDNTATVVISTEDFKKYLSSIGKRTISVQE